MKKIYYNIYYGIINLINYFPIIWKDRGYDYYFIYQLLQHKLKLTSKSLQKYGNFVNSEREVEVLNTIIKLIEREQTSYYELEFQKYYTEKIIINSKKILEFELINDNSEEYFKKYKKLYEKVKKNRPDSTNRRILIEMSMLQQKKCSELIWKLMSTNLNRWWY